MGQSQFIIDIEILQPLVSVGFTISLDDFITLQRSKPFEQYPFKVLSIFLSDKGAKFMQKKYQTYNMHI
jgi:hypothetical protein